MADPGKRLKILTDSEIRELYDLPEFNSEERAQYFALSQAEESVLSSLRSIRSKIYFILQLGYFKAKKMFFVFSYREVEEDIEYILHKYFYRHGHELRDIEVSKPTRLSQQREILELHRYRVATEETREKLEEKANFFVSIHSKPIYVFRELLSYLETHRVATPGYSAMQNIVGKALTTERTRLVTAISQYISEENYEAFDKILSSDEGGLYALTLLKKEPKDFSYKEISQEIKKLEVLKPIYNLAEEFFPNVGISNENIKYYASLVEYYTVQKMKRINRETAYLYLLCFIFVRYQKINDNLTKTFFYYVSQFLANAKQVAKEKVYEYTVEGNKYVKEAGRLIELYINDNIPKDTTFEAVQEMAFSILEKDKIPLLSKFISKTKIDVATYEWNHYVAESSKFKKNIRPLFLNLEFRSQIEEDPLLEAVTFLKDSFLKNKSLSQIKKENFPQEFIPKKIKRYIFESRDVKRKGKKRKIKAINGDKYEFLVYRLLKNRLDAGEIFIRNSLNFKNFEDDLVDNEQWEKNKEQLIKDLDIPFLQMSIDDILASFEEELESSLEAVNMRIKEGKNKDIKITGKGDHIKWSLPYKKEEESVNNLIYEQFRQIGVNDLLYFVDEHCDFISSFTHILDRYVKNEIEDHRIIASIVAFGTNIGLYKMAEISDMNYQEIVSTANNFIRLETLKKANDKISNVMATLPIFKYFNIREETIHSSSDGQKYETQFNTINSRYSPKYFGLKKGISAYTMVANHIPVNAKIIGANEHESHYVFDLLFNNSSEIIPDRHSTDTHGTNQVNFILLHVFGHMFAPRYAKLGSRSKMIYGFKNPKQYGDYLLKPIRKINTKLIKEEWKNILKIFVSLGFKSSTQSTIIRKLSSYARKNRTKKALWELDNIVKTLYILKYVDSIKLRRNVQKALNRGEAYNKLRKAVFYAFFGKFRVKTELEQQIWSECTRLITNRVVAQLVTP